ncbi:TrbI/VirB10 family protein [Pantoea sp. BAV 3049]|uniref:TrbI/VirB10 family protein n=1 Tax=Pantoea sp. BAV 3049 TaxID=2654188 RepID=UPI00131DF57C|nr:TrbI/VirB10 family protein [Pantoea sp. BAV 3049]
MSNKKADAPIDAGNRGIIEVKGKATSAKLLSFIAVGTGLIIAALLALALWPKKQPVQKGMEKTNEALLPEKSGSGLTGIMDRIKAQQKIDEENRKAAAEKAKGSQTPAPATATNAPPDNDMQTIAAGSATSPQNGTADDKDRPPTKAERQLTGETMVSIDNKQDAGTPKDNSDALQGSTYANGSVSPVLNRRYLLSAGTSMSCVLKTKIVTSYPGVTLCQLTKDVFSDDGKTLLARQGATLIGEQKQAMVQGNARVFVNWTTLKDENVSVRIGALGTDSLGASGLPAWVDSHFAERFGGALMLSLIGDTMDSLKNMTQQSSGNSGNITYDNSSDAAKELAKTTLENSINIPPTAYINQGSVLSIIVPRNIDFSSVYEVN